MNLEQFTSEFELARPQLKSYILRITASVEDTEDIVQDTYIRAVQKLDSFRGDSSVKTWVLPLLPILPKMRPLNNMLKTLKTKQN